MTPSPGAAPTVIVARRVLPGREDEFVAWHERIEAAARSQPGYISSELQHPDSAHPGEWVTVYSFEDAEHLDAWLASDARMEIVTAAKPLLAGPIREQRVAALRTVPEPVTAVFSQRIVPGAEAAFASLYEDVVRRLEAFDGFLGSQLLRPVPGVQEEYVVVASFVSRGDLDHWLESDSRRTWVEEAADVIEGERTVNVVGGFGGWFPAAPDQPRGPRRWKQAVAVLLALFPVSLLITSVRSEVAPDMNMVLAVLVANVLGVAALSFFLMPLVTRWLEGWLSR